MEKGLGIIVATKDKHGELKTDSIVGCDANFFSKTAPVVLQSADFSKVPTDRILYICGHGSKKKQTISGFSMKDLASMFVNAKYTGKQPIVIASCYGALKRHHKDMAQQLQQAFNDLGIDCTCSALATGTSFVWESDSEVQCNSVRFNKVFTSICMRLQDKFIKETPDANKTAIQHDYKVRAESVSAWNKNVATGRMMFTFSCISQLILLFYAMIFTIMYFIINYFIKIDITISIPVILIWIAAEIFGITGSRLSIVVWLPVLIAGFTNCPYLIAARLILSVILATMGIFAMFKKQGILAPQS